MIRSPHRTLLICLTMLLALNAACQQSPVPTNTNDPANNNTDQTGDSMKIQSAAFSANADIPARHTGEGEDVSPELSWNNAPADTKEFALICDDPDAPTDNPWVHWVIYKIPATTNMLPEGIPATATLFSPQGAMQGLNDWEETGYRGPMPPEGDGTHHYYFKLYALSAKLNVQSGLTKTELLDTMQGLILAETQLVGTYER